MGIAAALVLLAAAAGIGMSATADDRVTADEPQYLLTAISLARDGDLDIADELADRVWLEFHASRLPQQTEPRADGSELSPHNPLLPVLLVPPILLGDLLGVPSWVAAKAGLAALAAVLAAVLVWTAIRRFAVPPLPAAAVITVFGTSPPLSIYATQVYPELPAALCVAVAVAALTRTDLRWRHIALAGLAIVAMPWLAIKYAAVAVVLAGGLLWRLRARPYRLLGMAATLALAGIGYAAFNRVVYGGWTPYAAGDHFVGGELSVVGTDPDYLGRSQRLLGLLVDRDFGLLAWQPAWLLAVVALAWAACGGLRRSPGSVPVPILLAVVGAGWATATWVALTMHGWWWPGRQVVVVLPVLVLLVAAWAGHHRSRLVVAVLLGGVGVLSHAALVWGASGPDPRHSLVVDFTESIAPGYRMLRALLPDLADPSPSSTALFGGWLVLVTTAAWLGYSHSRRTGTTTGPSTVSSTRMRAP